MAPGPALPEPTASTPLLARPPATGRPNGASASAQLKHGRSSASPTSTVDKITIYAKSYAGYCLHVDGHLRRKWKVVVVMNGEERDPVDLVDPLTASDYASRFNPRLHSGRSPTVSDEPILEEIWQGYFNQLFDQLKLGCCEREDRRISVHEDVTGLDESSDVASLHCLLWEILENPSFWPCAPPDGRPVKTIRLNRTLNVVSIESPMVGPARHPSGLVGLQPECRVLLIISRSFKRASDQRYVDYRPSLILGPLLEVALRAKKQSRAPRVHIQVVRPGTMDELERQLDPKNCKTYDIVHFDLHGKIGPVKNSPNRKALLIGKHKSGVTPQVYEEHQAYLRFGKSWDEYLPHFSPSELHPIELLLHDDTSLYDVPVKQIAKRLRDCRVSRVALSSCLSSYAQSRMILNMCHTFLKHDIADVSAMSFPALDITAQIYYTAFYKALILHGQSFHEAAARGRDALRASQLQKPYAMVPTNYHRHPRSFSLPRGLPSPRGYKGLPRSLRYLLRCTTSSSPLLLLGLAQAWLPQRILPQVWPISFAATVALWLLTKSWITDIPDFADSDDNQNARRLKFDIDIEHMVIEDRLMAEANGGALYIWSTDYSAELRESAHDLASIWVQTGFVNSADVIPASVFASPLASIPSWRWLRTSKYRSEQYGLVDRQRDPLMPDGTGQGLSTIPAGHKRLLVINGFDQFYSQYPRGDDGSRPAILQVALSQMAAFIESHNLDETYLIITGAYDREWWEDGTHFYNDERIVGNISRAVPHNHNVTPPPRPLRWWDFQARRHQAAAARWAESV